MSLGPRLVIPGAILSSTLLAVFLFVVSAGATYTVYAPPADPILQSGQGQPAPVSDQAPSGDQVADTGLAGCALSSSFPDRILKWCDLITHYSVQRDLPPDLIAALILQESGGNPSAYSHSGAVGLMQVMPRDGLAAAFMCKAGPCFTDRPTIAELEDPEFNIAYGTRMLADLYRRYGDMREALKAYGPMDVGYYYADIVLGHYRRYGD